MNYYTNYWEEIVIPTMSSRDKIKQEIKNCLEKNKPNVVVDCDVVIFKNSLFGKHSHKIKLLFGKCNPS